MPIFSACSRQVFQFVSGALLQKDRDDPQNDRSGAPRRAIGQPAPSYCRRPPRPDPRRQVKACEHPDIRQDRSVIFGMAIAVGADIHYHINMEAGAAVHHGFGVLRDLAVQDVIGAPFPIRDGVKIAPSQALSALAHFSSSTCALFSMKEMAFWAQSWRRHGAPAAFFRIYTTTLPPQCRPSCRRGLPQPMPIFLSAPPKPVLS